MPFKFNPLQGALNFVPASAAAGNGFGIIQPPAGTSPTASMAADTLNFTTSDATAVVTGTAATKTIDFKVGQITHANINSGTGASSTTFYRGDDTWAAPAAPGPTAVVSEATNYTLGASDDTVIFTAAATATLPTAVGVSGKTYTIKHSAASTFMLTIATTSAQTVEGLASGTIIMTALNDFLKVESDGANWFIVNNGWTIGSQVTRITTNYTTAAGSSYIIKFNSAIVDTGGTSPWYSTTTGLFTAPMGGSYLFTFSGLAQTGGNVALGKNGTTIVGPNVFASDSSTVYYTGSTTVTLAAGDTIGVYSYVGGVLGAQTFYDADNTYFTAQRLGN